MHMLRPLWRNSAGDFGASGIFERPEWFPELPSERSRARNSNKYLEEHAKTSRLFNSPLFYMRRRLNALEHDPVVRAQVGGAAVHSQHCDFVFDEWR